MDEGMPFVRRKENLRESAMRKVIILSLVLMLCGCKVIEYVPVETVRTEVVHQTDTVKEKESTKKESTTVIREASPEDSAMLAKLGIKLKSNERLLILLQKELAETRKELEQKHSNDSVHTEYKDRPYPVEKKLTKWQSFCIDYGKIMLGSTIAGVIIIVLLIIIYRRKK